VTRIWLKHRSEIHVHSKQAVRNLRHWFVLSAGHAAWHLTNLILQMRYITLLLNSSALTSFSVKHRWSWKKSPTIPWQSKQPVCMWDLWFSCQWLRKLLSSGMWSQVIQYTATSVSCCHILEDSIVSGKKYYYCFLHHVLTTEFMEGPQYWIAVHFTHIYTRVTGLSILDHQNPDITTCGNM